MQKSHLRSWVGCRNPALRWDQIFIPGGKGGIPLPKVGSRHSHLGSWAGLLGSHLYPAWHFTWVLGAELNVVQSAMDLGSYCMLWPEMDRPHIFNSCKANCMMGFIKRKCIKDLKRDLVKTPHLSLVRSHLCYTFQLWALQSPTLMFKIKNVQHRATRFICKDPGLSYKERLSELNLRPLNNWLEYLDIVNFFKCKLGLIDLKRNDLYEFCSEHSRRGASGLFFKNMKAKTSPYRDSFFVRICNTWNTLPGNVRAGKELPSFVKKLKSSFYLRLSKVFNQDIHFLKYVCVDCHCFNTPNACTC